jgi:hypothetical protein
MPYFLRRRLGSISGRFGKSKYGPQICTAGKFAQNRACGGGRTMPEMVIGIIKRIPNFKNFLLLRTFVQSLI